MLNANKLHFASTQKTCICQQYSPPRRAPLRPGKQHKHSPCFASPDWVEAGPSDTPPDYKEIDRQPLNKFITRLFRKKMAAYLGTDTRFDGYEAIIDLTRQLNKRYETPGETQRATQQILRSLFPAWLLPAFRVNNVDLGNGKAAKAQGVHIERCRYLEESGCASICINSCKVPTQMFFSDDMGLALSMTPNYEDFSCQFNFGVQPMPQEQDEVFKTPCFSQCPSKKAHRGRRQCPSVEP